MVENAARRALAETGTDPDAYDAARTVKYLKAKAEATAANINATTKDQLDEALDDEDADPADVFDAAEGSRSMLSAITLTTALAAFGTVEAGKQSGAATKTWIVTSGNPRPSHAAMDGETVGIEDDFSNGMPWPGASGDADEVAGCSCEVEFNYP
jgi:hypothetical protein